MKRLAVALPAACLLGAAIAADTPAPDRVFKLDPMLREISGLAPATERSVFAHNDEHAIIHEIDIRGGDIIRSFAFGKPTLKGDFEGIAVVGPFAYLVTSDGFIYEGRITAHRERTPANIYDTGLGAIDEASGAPVCEIEGLAAAGPPRTFFLLCKRAAADPQRQRLIIYRWADDNRLTPLTPFLDIPLAGLAPKPEKGSFRAADLEYDAARDRFTIVDSNVGGVLEITASGERIDYVALDHDAHPQAEGLTRMPDGALIIGDEGTKKSGRLSVYAPGSFD